MTQPTNITDKPIAHALQDSRERLWQLERQSRKRRWQRESQEAREALAQLTALAKRGERRRTPSEATEINRIEKATGKTVTSYITPDGTTYRFGEVTEQQSDTDREWAEFEARNGKA
jgi:hypothetical protein